MQVAGIYRVGARVEMIEADEPAKRSATGRQERCRCETRGLGRPG
jgi:hypothetical protein